MDILQVNHVSKIFKKENQTIEALRDISFSVKEGESLGILGGSGSGKSTLARIIAGLLLPDQGTIQVGKQEAKNSEWKKRSHLQMVFQSPRAAFDPRWTLGKSLIEGLLQKGCSLSEAKALAVRSLVRCQLTEEYMSKYPHQVSGGECQRASIARAIAWKPDILICDEITSALDATIQKEILELLLQLKQEEHLTLLVITHHMGLAQKLCDTLLILHHGHMVEYGNVDTVLHHPQDPYTKRLLEAAKNS